MKEPHAVSAEESQAKGQGAESLRASPPENSAGEKAAGRQFLLLSAALLVLLLLFVCFFLPRGTYLELRDRKSDTVIAEWRVSPGDQLSLEIEHSFEHIPWYEFYTVTEDLQFNLDAIAVAGYGAGIPAEMDVPTHIEDGLVWMEEINSLFPTLHWITSDKYMKTFTLNGEEIFDFRSLPDASRVEAKMITKRGYFCG